MVARSRMFTFVSILLATFAINLIGAELGAFRIIGRFVVNDLHVILGAGCAYATVAATSVLLIPKCRESWAYWLKGACVASACCFIPMAWFLVVAIVGI